MFSFTRRCRSRCQTGPVPFLVSFSWWSKHHSSSINVRTQECWEKASPEARIRQATTSKSSKDNDSYADRCPYVETASAGNEQQYHFNWLDNTTARVCFGCRGRLRPSDSSVPPPPFDVVVSTKEHRCWYDKSTETTKISKKPEPMYYHVKPVCILEKNAKFQASLHLSITSQDRERMLDIHKNFLKQSLTITIV